MRTFATWWVARFSAQAKLLGSPLLSSEEREASLKPFIADIAPDRTLGSRIWVTDVRTPRVDVAKSRPGTIYGYHRSFSVDMLLWRASPGSCPGLMLALDRGGSCQGVAHKIAAEQVETELRILWMREMLGGIYQPRWVQVQMDTKDAVRAITFVANREHPRYMGKLPGTTSLPHCQERPANPATPAVPLPTRGQSNSGIVDGPMHRLARLVRHLREPERSSVGRRPCTAREQARGARRRRGGSVQSLCASRMFRVCLVDQMLQFIHQRPKQGGEPHRHLGRLSRPVRAYGVD